MVKDQAYYANGYNKSISAIHALRTVESNVSYVLDVLKPNFKVLDVGSGPGTITVDFGANYLTEGGSIIGVEPTPEILEDAEAYKKKYSEEHGKNLDNVSFQKGSIYKLPFEDNSFDLVHAHQVFLHLQDPVAGLKELKRVAKQGGFVCVKDGDIESTLIYPEEYEKLRDIYVLKAKNSGYTDPRAGRKLRGRAIEAGYEPANIKTTVSNRVFGDDQDTKKLMGKLLIDRAKNGGEEFYPDDLERSKRVREESIELLTKFTNDITSLDVSSSFQIIYHKN
ncbi:uncharacterized protein SPAPADRAFT_59079 [Spathaspora passalidarum NRRL Y-27907]|uniref:Methyltransferase domain-containing protein n=1 Tax=Spathaspora passalidarum (strain NRRL Y-27907 / 11-Y1) TaxID=619300 RepID=G3AIJ6_SPAPN|nr:uncharacterized protein SPAPADRAFT_59079 [Spathaspora passalidarum NRRL Y-27907]EGW33711.1 hypothetical protein SPAPADRAFT_59079 [Spathaspora passalidarum NRRL Y-27907]